MEKIKRSLFASFLNTSPGETSPTWARMGKGITSQTITYNAESNSEQYIDEDSATTTLDSYAPTMNGAMSAYAGEPIFEYVDGLRKSRAVGADSESDILLVYIYDKDTTSGAYAAEKQHVSIQIDDFGGDAGGSLPVNFTINFMGDSEQGTATITSGSPTFTAAT